MHCWLLFAFPFCFPRLSSHVSGRQLRHIPLCQRVRGGVPVTDYLSLLLLLLGKIVLFYVHSFVLFFFIVDTRP